MHRRPVQSQPPSPRPAAFLLVATAILAPPAAAQQPGDLVITEVMVAPPTGNHTYREWFEVYTVDTVELENCLIIRSPTADPDDSVYRDEIRGVGTVWAEEYLLFARDERYVVGEEGEPDARRALFTYDYLLSFPNNERFFLMLMCGDVVLDSVAIEWAPFAEHCEGNGCAVALRPELTDAGLKDELPDGWCLPPDELAFTNSSGDVATGSPGEENECRIDDHPTAGELAFTELMIAPGSTPEWIELHNPTPRALLLEDCRIGHGDSDGGAVLQTWQGAPLHLEPGETRVLAHGACLDTVMGHPDQPLCRYDEIVYVGLELDDEAPRVLELVCPTGDGETLEEVVVDSVRYDLAGHDTGARRSLQFATGDPAAAAVDNDDWEAWCAAADTQCFHGSDEGTCEYGTPGKIGECHAPPAGDDAGCECQTGSAGGLGAVGLIGALLGALVRLRRRKGGT